MTHSGSTDEGRVNGESICGDVELYREAVTETLVRLMEVSVIDGVPADQAVEEFFGKLSEGSAILMTHEDPFLVACAVAGIPDNEMESRLAASRPAYENLLAEFDEKASRRTTPGSGPAL